MFENLFGYVKYNINNLIMDSKYLIKKNNVNWGTFTYRF